MRLIIFYRLLIGMAEVWMWVAAGRWELLPVGLMEVDFGEV
jgi:hypothetical protein